MRGRRITVVDGARASREEVLRLRKLVTVLLAVYWESGDGGPPPKFIAAAKREADRLSDDELRSTQVERNRDGWYSIVPAGGDHRGDVEGGRGDLELGEP